MRWYLGVLGLVVACWGSCSVVSAQLVAPEGYKEAHLREGNPPAAVWVNPQPAGVELPEGVSHQTFHSDAIGEDIGFCVYLPPNYDQESDRRYPVIYTLHGNGGNEWKCLLDAEVLHEGIVAGRWPSVIMVMPNGGHNTFYKDSAVDSKFRVETMFIKELIPHIDATYRTIADGSGRCIEGFSMGGRGSTRLAMKYPDMFCSLFCQAGNVPRIATLYDPAHPETYPNSLLGPDRENYVNNDVFELLQKNLKQIKKGLRIQIACGTKDGGHLPTVREFHVALLEAGVDHTYIELEGLAHKKTEMIARLRPIWFDYHVESLRRAAERSGKN
ncbi:MAG: hypothetical protein KDA88_16620 [Planctomycetaceae bacterium]|nr:hypothetical protein [Planctomycetaceae bacterium]MCA9032994.1 hypothetical protein [Planctomycetaceae bacterium]MCB9949456.1 hypothetical protein [Planctomycetaceae bacterium]